jgi:hypothetical protein
LELDPVAAWFAARFAAWFAAWVAAWVVFAVFAWVAVLLDSVGSMFKGRE